MQNEKPLIVVSVLDPAIDTESMTAAEMRAYITTRDMKHLKLHAGTQPTRYHLREIRHSVWESYIMAAEGEAERHRRAFLCAVVQVDNLVQSDGSILPGPYTHANVPREPALPESEAERFQPRVRAEIGLVAFTRGFLAWGIEPTYQLPDLLVPYLGARTFLRADAIPPSPAPSSSPASSGEPATSAPPSETTRSPSASGANSDSPTAATATAQAAGCA